MTKAHNVHERIGTLKKNAEPSFQVLLLEIKIAAFLAACYLVFMAFNEAYDLTNGFWITLSSVTLLPTILVSLVWILWGTIRGSLTALRVTKIRWRIMEMDEASRRVNYRIASGDKDELARLEAEEADLIVELKNKV